MLDEYQKLVDNQLSGGIFYFLVIRAFITVIREWNLVAGWNDHDQPNGQATVRRDVFQIHVFHQRVDR